MAAHSPPKDKKRIASLSSHFTNNTDIIQQLIHSKTIEVLDLVPKKIKDKEFWKALRKAIELNTSITKLIIYANENTDYLIEVLSGVLKNNSITEIVIRDIKNAVLNERVATKLGMVIREKQNIKRLKFVDLEIPEFTYILGIIARHNETLEELSLKRVSLMGDSEGILKGIGDVLLNNKSLKSLKLHTLIDNLNDIPFYHISEALKINTTLESLEYNFIRFDAKTHESFCEMLKVNTTLKSLLLTDMFFYNPKAILESIVENKGINVLMFADGTINDAELMSRLIQSAKLESLNLNGTKMKLDVAKSIFKSLENDTTLVCLDISEIYCLDATIFKSIAEMLFKNETLSSLNIAGIVRDYVESIYPLDLALQHNTTLTEINISWNMLTSDASGQLLKSVAQNEVLEVLFCLQCIMGEQRQHLITLVEENKTLKKLVTDIFMIGFDEDGEPVYEELDPNFMERLVEVMSRNSNLIRFGTEIVDADQINKIMERNINNNHMRTTSLYDALFSKI